MASKSRFKPVVEVVDETQKANQGQAKDSPDKNLEQKAEKTLKELENIQKNETKKQTSEPTPKPTPPNDQRGKEDKEKDGISFKLVIIIAVITAIIVAVVSGGVYVYYSGITKSEEEQEAPTPAPTKTPTPTPSPTPTPDSIDNYDLTTYSISILNGSGRIGEASTASNLLEENNFLVENTGNADRFDYEQTLIQHKTDTPQVVVDEITKILGGIYQTQKSTPLEDNSSYDIIITLGSNSPEVSEE